MSGLNKVLHWLLLGFALCMPISISLSEPCILLSFCIWCILLLRNHYSRESFSYYLIWILLFFLCAVISVTWSIRPQTSLLKLHRLLLFSPLFILPSVLYTRKHPCCSKEGIPYILLFLAGSSVLGLYDVFRVPFEVFQGTPLFHTGNMRDPQIYMVSLCFLIAMYGSRTFLRYKYIYYFCLLVNSIGIVLHFKRGVWISTFFAVISMAWMFRRRKLAMAVVASMLFLLLLPQTRTRIIALQDTVSLEAGGRYALWSRVAPALIMKHPLGLGWSSVAHEHLEGYTPYIQPGLNHMHNNALEIVLELGWLGLCIWLGWMFHSTKNLYENYRYARTNNADWLWIAIGSMGAFLGLMINGMVEYNFGDSEMIMIFGFILGISQYLTKSIPKSRV